MNKNFVKYGDHLSGCKKRSSADSLCTCGFDEALREERKPVVNCEHGELRAIDDHWGTTIEQVVYDDTIHVFERRKYLCVKCYKIITINEMIEHD